MSREDDLKQVADYFKQMAALDRRDSDLCPNCNSHIDEMEQVGRCVYAKPCGCRLWQGAVPEKWRKDQE
jgi:hypothetical protein